MRYWADCDNMSVSEQEQAVPAQSERRMPITGCACDMMGIDFLENKEAETCGC